MKCLITGLETDDKWRNKPISRYALEAARKYQEIYPGLSMREVLKKIQKDYLEKVREEASKE